MNYKELKEILLQHYELTTVKHLLRRSSNKRPSYKKAEEIEQSSKGKVPIQAWKDIRGWLDKQEAK